MPLLSPYCLEIYIQIITLERDKIEIEKFEKKKNKEKYCLCLLIKFLKCLKIKLSFKMIMNQWESKD